jgi:hypothetical protein
VRLALSMEPEDECRHPRLLFWIIAFLANAKRGLFASPNLPS